MKTMASKGVLDTKKQKLTNHSMRKHFIQKLRSDNVPPTDIMQLSGHKNIKYILNYSSVTENRHKVYSHILNGGRIKTHLASYAYVPSTVTSHSQHVSPVSEF